MFFEKEEEEHFFDKICIDGTTTYTLSEEPLKEFQTEINEAFIADEVATDKIKNYKAFWLLDEKRLYLKDLKVVGTSGLKSVFEGRERVFANWFSGEIIITKPPGIIARVLKDYKVTKKHHYTFKDGNLTSFIPIDYTVRIDPDEEPF